MTLFCINDIMYLEDKKGVANVKRFTSEEMAILYLAIGEEEKEWRRALLNAQISGNEKQARFCRNKITSLKLIQEKLWQ